MDTEEDPRVKEERCRVTRVGPTGIEWICIKPVHAKIYYRKVGDKSHKKGDRIYANNPQVDYHYMVNRWPGR